MGCIWILSGTLGSSSAAIGFLELDARIVNCFASDVHAKAYKKALVERLMAAFLDPKSKLQDSELIQMDCKLRGKNVSIPKELNAIDELGSDSGEDEESEEDEEDEDEEEEDDDASDGGEDTPFPYVLEML